MRRALVEPDGLQPHSPMVSIGRRRGDLDQIQASAPRPSAKSTSERNGSAWLTRRRSGRESARAASADVRDDAVRDLSMRSRRRARARRFARCSSGVQAGSSRGLEAPPRPLAGVDSSSAGDGGHGDAEPLGQGARSPVRVAAGWREWPRCSRAQPMGHPLGLSPTRSREATPGVRRTGPRDTWACARAGRERTWWSRQAAPPRQASPATKRVRRSRASASVNCWGGLFMK